MSVTAVVGAQWGDEGKGRIVDYLAQTADMVLRFQGGANAGHTVINQYGTFGLHLVPSGIFNPATCCIVGTGAVVEPDSFLEETEKLRQAGISLENLWLSERCHIVMPYHRALDSAQEDQLQGKKIGTTKRGIGPTYADRAARVGVRLGDLKRPVYLKERLERSLPAKNRLLQDLGHAPYAIEELLESARMWHDKLGHRIVDTLPLIQQAILQEQNVLLEGQLGVMRDLDWGIYPYVTSSNPITGGASVGAGLPPTSISRVVGVVKAYSTAVGAGPFPVELFDKDGDQLRKHGQEFGVTTGRPRRCGWFDGVAIAYAAWLNGFTELAITKLDILDSFSEIKICVAYRYQGETLKRVPDTSILEEVEPVYESWPGWQSSTRDVREWEKLPEAARNYVRRIEALAGIPVRTISTGPERSELMLLDEKSTKMAIGP